MLRPEDRVDAKKAHSANSSPIASEKRDHNHHQPHLLGTPSAPKQRHSTGNLATGNKDEAGPKGILKRPHTFHERQRPLSVGRQQHQHHSLFQLPRIGNDQQKVVAKKEPTPKKPVEELQKTPQHVGFTEMDAVAVFGDTTTDTDGGLEPNSSSARLNGLIGPSNGPGMGGQSKNVPQLEQQRQMMAGQRKGGAAPPAAIVSPYIRQPKTESQPLPATRGNQQMQPIEQLRTETNGFVVPSSTAGPATANQPRPTAERHEWSPEGSESGGSVQSGGTGQSHIVGKWWFGPSTKFVVHCDRRGCSHGHRSKEGTPTGDDHHQQGGEEPYLTPTQRQQKEVAALKKELRRSQLACREKERHLVQLRDRLGEIESMMSSSSDTQMAQLAQMRQKMAEKEEEYGNERAALNARHDHKVRQLVQEAVDLRAELARKEKILADRERIQLRDQAVQASEEPDSAANKSERDSLASTAIQVGSPIEEVVTMTKNSELSFAPTTTVSVSERVSPSKAPIVQIGAEVLATLEAYRAETVIWRTRCANLELIMQDLLLREGTRPGDVPLGNTLYINLEGGEFEEKPAASAQGISTERAGTLERRGGEHSREQSLQPQMRRGAECQQAGCVERKKKLAEENERLVEQTQRLETELEPLRDKNMELDREMHRVQREFGHLAKEHSELATLAETRLNEAKAIKLTLHRVESERNKFEQALAYLERRCQAMEQIGLDQGIVLAEEDPLELFGPLSKEFNVRGSKATQTALTVDALDLSEKAMDELQVRLRVMQATFADDKAQMGTELAEIERVLMLKTELVNKLTGQLDEAAKRTQAEDQRHQRERDVFMGRIEELGHVAERMPILESEIERALTDKSRCELQLREVEGQLDDLMEQALDTALGRNRAQEDYWSERLDAVERERKEVKALLEHERRVKADQCMQWSLDRAELDRRLTSAIEHVGLLNARINCPKRDAQCEVRPRTLSKYVTCRPNQRDQQTGAELRDTEMDELKQVAARLADEREFLLGEMGRLETEAQLATATIQRERLSQIERKRGPADFLTVSFHRKGELVELGGGSSLVSGSRRTAGGLSSPGDAISIVSLPTVLEHHGQAFAGRPAGAAQSFVVGKARSNSMNYRGNSIREREEEEEMEQDEEDIYQLKPIKSVHRERSLPPAQMASTLGGPRPSAQARCHSAPRRQELDGSQQQLLLERVESHQQLVDGQQQMATIGRVQIPTIQITSAEEVRERVQALRVRMHELLTTGVANEIPCAVGEEELFDQLDGWLRAMAENEKRSWEAQQSVEALKRESGRLRDRLKDAEMELWIYRTEPRRAAVERLAEQHGWLSCSAEHLGTGPPLSTKQLRRWKEIAGTCFREVNQLRKRLTASEDERLELRNTVAILKGELAMAKCQNLHTALMKRGGQGEFGEDGIGETLASYNRWLGGDRWQSVPDLDEADLKMRPGRRRKTVADSGKEKEIVNEALRRQHSQLRRERDRLAQMEQETAEELRKKQKAEEELGLELKKVKAECQLLSRENGMYEQKLVEMDKDRQQMYLVMFRKGQQAANQAMDDDLDKAAELQIVLRFLHDAFFYYLLNKGNAREHLQAIMTMLNFTIEQKEEVYKRRGKSH